jgi:hypothetical protein
MAYLIASYSWSCNVNELISEYIVSASIEFSTWRLIRCHEWHELRGVLKRLYIWIQVNVYRPSHTLLCPTLSNLLSSSAQTKGHAHWNLLIFQSMMHMRSWWRFIPLHRIQPIVTTTKQLGTPWRWYFLDTGKTLEYGLADEGFVPGCDYAGVVQEVGSNVKKVKKGDRVRLLTCHNLRLHANSSVIPGCRLDYWRHCARSWLLCPIYPSRRRQLV